MCEIYKTQHITIRINGNEYYAPIKRIYQTFYNKIVEVPVLDKWFPAKIVGKASEKPIVIYEDKLWCSLDLLKQINPDISDNSYKKTDITSDWLFGIEFQDPSIESFTLTCGMTIPAK